MAIVLLVRHGQASFGADDYDVLSEAGWAQSRRLGAHLAAHGVVPTTVVRGGMRRHRETVAGLLAGLREAGGAAAGDADVVGDAGWDEFDHLGVVAAHPDLPQGGTAELDRRVFQQVFETATRRWALTADDEAGSQDYPETFDAFARRATAALERAVGRVTAAGSGATVLVVTSGGPIGVLGAALLDPAADDREARARLWSRLNTVCVNSSVSRVVVGGGGVRLLTFNEHTHLDRATTTYR